MGEACNTHGTDENCEQNLQVRKPEGDVQLGRTKRKLEDTTEIDLKIKMVTVD
jgi:hypothetical protein